MSDTALPCDSRDASLRQCVFPLPATYFNDNVPDCTGCEACLNACPVDAISMSQDAGGFRFPGVDTLRCVGCKVCLRTCPVINDKQSILHLGTPTPDVYAAWSCDLEIVEASSSGGVFSVLAEAVIQQGGCVFGAVMEDARHVRHCKAESIEQIRPMRGSKYLQSCLGNTYRDVKKNLLIGRLVLFSGTPCQVAGLLCYLGATHPKLITCEVLCHGVPSDTYVCKYIDWLEATRGVSVSNVDFRNKRNGWKKFGLVHHFSDGSQLYHQLLSSPYMNAYLCNLALRRSCASCRVSRLPRVADISLGDFWGVDKTEPSWNSRMGVGLVIVNTQQGKAFYAELKDCLISTPVLLECACVGNPVILQPLKAHSKRAAFLHDLKHHSFHYLRWKYARYISPPFNRWYAGLKHILQQLRRFARAVISTTSDQ